MISCWLAREIEETTEIEELGIYQGWDVLILVAILSFIRKLMLNLNNNVSDQM